MNNKFIIQKEKPQLVFPLSPQNPKLCRVLMILICLVLVVSLVGSVHALDLDREERINFGHVMRIREIYTEPDAISPGDSGMLNMKIQNIADFEIYDIRVKLNLPSGISLLNDISRIKIAKLVSGEIEDLQYQLIVSPTASEGIYESSYTINYINNLGDEREDVDNFTIIVKSTPNIFVKIEDSEVYKKSYTGDVTFKFINNEIAEVKYLTVELKDSIDYDIISGSREYIGDLDSDDFESVSFRVRVTNEDKKEIVFQLKVTYKDALNNNYEQVLNAKLIMRSGVELGKGNGTSYTTIFIVLLAVVGGYFWYRRHKKKKESHSHK